MNCLEFRREMLVDPRRVSDEAQAHSHLCSACADFRAKTLKLDDEIADGFAVPVPDGFASRVIAFSKDGHMGSRRRVMALAASVALASSVGAGVFLAQRDDPLARAGIDFVVEEEANAILTAKPADPNALMRVEQSMNVSLPEQLGEVRYIGICPFQGTIAHHVVIITPQGKATLLLLPEKRLDGRAQASARGLRSIVRPAGGGSLAIIADSSRSLERIEGMVTRS